ncbi:MAG TPA: NUDIX domain-containing protein [Devosia sp.]
MNERVRVIDKEVLADSWGKLTRWTLELQRRSGEWQRQTRETYDRGDGAAILLYDPDRKTVILTRQFRFPVYFNGEPGYIIEVCAGKLDGDDPATCARKEAEEETGYRVTDVRQVFRSYMSPGSVTERLSLFIVQYDADKRVSEGGGHAHEGEDIEVLELPFAQALEMVEAGEINDAKTVMLLQYAALKGLL